MVYIYKKTIGNKEYYYLRASKMEKGRMITKDIAYLGSTLEEVKKSLNKIPKAQIRVAYKKINKFLESNKYLKEAQKLKIKQTLFLDKSLLEEIEACQLHWQKIFKKLDKKTQEDYFKGFIIDFAFNTTSIEGNTITLKEASMLLTEQRTPKNRTLREIYDIQNTESVFMKLLEEKKGLTHEFIIQMHKELMANTDFRHGYRTSDVHVMHSRFEASPAPYVSTDMDILINWYNENKNKLHPFILACIFHHKFEKIHPFFDGNGRTGRMLMNFILLNANYPPIIIRKRNRAEYLETLSRADGAGLKDIPAKSYKPLIEFSANEYTDNYWDVFL